MVAGQADARLHTMAKELSDKEEVELRRATDLSLRATKETARVIGHSVAALVETERHLWLNLSELQDKDRFFLLDAPLSPNGLFVNISK